MHACVGYDCRMHMRIYGMGVVNVCDLEPHGPLCVNVRGSAGWGSRVKATGSVRRYFEG